MIAEIFGSPEDDLARIDIVSIKEGSIYSLKYLTNSTSFRKLWVRFQKTFTTLLKIKRSVDQIYKKAEDFVDELLKPLKNFEDVDSD